jgi:REP element-mobilizing transposase RayT
MTHSYKIHFFHLIWSTKNRQYFINPSLKEQLYPYIGGIVRNLDGTLMEIGGMEDHVHLLLYMKNLDKYSEFIRDVKANSSKWINKNYDLQDKFEWQEGFASITVSYSTIDSVRAYIRNQEEHHKTMTFEDEYLKFLDGMGVEYDKRFVFG